MKIQNEQPILSLNFERDPKEQVQVMLAAGRRFYRGPGASWRGLLLFAVSTGAFIGMMVVLSSWLSGADVPDGRDISFFLIPVFLYAIILFRVLSSRRMALLETRFKKNVACTVEIYPSGFKMISDLVEMWLDWSAVRQIVMAQDRIDFDSEGFVIYIPLRAFRDKADMMDKAGEIQILWHKAVSG